MPVFGAISGIGIIAAGSALNAVMENADLQKKMFHIWKQLGITKEEVANRRKEQELEPRTNAAKLMDRTLG